MTDHLSRGAGGRDANRHARYAAAARRIQLVLHAHRLLATPLTPHSSGCTASSGSGRFPLPRLPLSLVHWCGAVADRFRRRRVACLALALLLDRRSGRWFAVPVPQRCGRAHARWLGHSLELPDLAPELLVCGSFQTASAADVRAAASRVPQFDGVHLVQHRSAASAWTFLRCEGGEPMLAEPARLMVDDVEDVLRRYAGRLHVR